MGRVPNVESDALTSPEYQVWRISDSTVLPEYVEILIRMPFFNRLVQVHRVGAVKQRLFVRNLMDIRVPRLSLDAQRGIVQQWHDAETTAEELHRQAEAIERDATKEFLHQLGLKLPEEIKLRKCFALRWDAIDRWGVGACQPSTIIDVSASCYPVHPLGDLVADFENGWSPKCLERPATRDEWGVLKLGAVSFGNYRAHENKALPKTEKPKESIEVRKGDVLITRSNTLQLVGACVCVGETRPRLMIPDLVFRVVFNSHLSALIPQYLAEIMRSPHLRFQIEMAAAGTSPTMKKITKAALTRFQIPVPPLGVQQIIISQVSQARTRAATLRNQAEAIRAQALAAVEAAILGRQPPISAE